MLYRYTRTADGGLKKAPVTKAEVPATGEMIALPGKKHRSYKAPVILGPNNKPIKPPLIKLPGKKGA